MTTAHGRPVYESVDAWRAEAVKRFGASPAEWRFVCPACGHEATCADFKELGADPERASFECIGRVLNELGRREEVYQDPPEREVVGYDDDGEPIHGEAPEWPKRRESGKPCNWCSFGLFGTLNAGTLVKREGGGETWAFDFAEVPLAAD